MHIIPLLEFRAVCQYGAHKLSLLLLICSIITTSFAVQPTTTLKLLMIVVNRLFPFMVIVVLHLAAADSYQTRLQGWPKVQGQKLSQEGWFLLTMECPSKKKQFFFRAGKVVNLEIQLQMQQMQCCMRSTGSRTEKHKTNDFALLDYRRIDAIFAI